MEVVAWIASVVVGVATAATILSRVWEMREISAATRRNVNVQKEKVSPPKDDALQHVTAMKEKGIEADHRTLVGPSRHPVSVDTGS